MPATTPPPTATGTLASIPTLQAPLPVASQPVNEPPQNTVGGGKDETLAAVESLLREMGESEMEEKRYDPGSPATSYLVNYVSTPKDKFQQPQTPPAAAEIPLTAAISEGNGPTTSAPTDTHAVEPHHRRTRLKMVRPATRPTVAEISAKPQQRRKVPKELSSILSRSMGPAKDKKTIKLTAALRTKPPKGVENVDVESNRSRGRGEEKDGRPTASISEKSQGRKGSRESQDKAATVLN